MSKDFNCAMVTLGTSETTVHTAYTKGMTLLIQLVNTSASTVTCELWITDDSNNHVACLLPSKSIAAKDGITDTTKHIVISGYKIRGTASTAGVVYVEVSVLEGI